MHITLPDSGNGQLTQSETLLSEEMTADFSRDPVWQALRSGAIRLPLAPQFSSDEVRSLIDKLREPKMMEQLQDLLQQLPEESQQLLDALQDTRLQSA